MTEVDRRMRQAPVRRQPTDLSRWPAMARPRPAGVRASVAALLLHSVVRRTGISVEWPDGTLLGQPDSPRLRVNDRDAFLRRLGRDGKIGFGESYMAGDWDSPDLVEVLTPMARQMGTIVPKPFQAIRRLYDAGHPADEDGDRPNARRNIARHYDLSNDLFSTFLDETMTYSAALFSDPGCESMGSAQRRKIDRLLDATRVREGTRVLEIGSGWGELAMRAAARGAHVTTVTLSIEQAALARERFSAAGVSDRIDLRVQDYRDVSGEFDAVVSVEMVEAVGERWWPTYFRTLDERLAPGGRIGLQAILMPHERLMASRRSWTWIHKYIFPGGLLLSERVVDDVLAGHTSLQVSDRLAFGSSYAETLRRWRERFDDAADEVDRMGFDETFRRMWSFYLAYCEAGFRSGYLDVEQLVLTRPGDRTSPW
jgi:cyclopropane-fatty-acyl-phospholipid synthase